MPSIFQAYVNCFIPCKLDQIVQLYTEGHAELGGSDVNNGYVL